MSKAGNLRPSALLVEYEAAGRAYRETAGTFGSYMASRGVVGGMVTRLKERLVQVPPVYLGAMAGSLHRAGYRVLHSLDGRPPRGEKPALVIIATSLVRHDEELALAARIRARYPDALVGFAGALASVRPELFSPHGHFVLTGEPDLALAAALSRQLPWSGLIHGRDGGHPADLPPLYWAPFPLRSYSYFPMLPRGRFLPLLASRGCPHACGYCAYTAIPSTHLVLEPGAVVEQIRRLKRDHGVSSVLFRDRCFGADPRATRTLLEALIQADLQVAWACETRPDTLDRQMLTLAARAGCRCVSLGIEAASESALRAAGRHAPSVERGVEAVRQCHEAGLEVAAFYILGLPGERPEDVERTIRLSQRLNTLTAQFTLMTPFPGTSFHEQEKPRITARRPRELTEYEPALALEQITADQLRGLRDRAFRQYYARPAWLWRRGPAVLRALVR